MQYKLHEMVSPAPRRHSSHRRHASLLVAGLSSTADPVPPPPSSFKPSSCIGCEFSIGSMRGLLFLSSGVGRQRRMKQVMIREERGKKVRRLYSYFVTAEPLETLSYAALTLLRLR